MTVWRGCQAGVHVSPLQDYSCLRFVNNFVWYPFIFTHGQGETKGTERPLRYQYNQFDHPCAVRSSVLGFDKNPYKPYIFWKLNNYRL